MTTQFETWARERFWKEIDLERTNAPEGSPDFRMYRSSATRLLFEGWKGAMETMAEMEQ
jgi:hypothetical protein